jgi:PAS domain S-box-containing protein
MKINLEKLKTITILYVEDDIKIMESISAMFSKMFNNVYTATNGDDGLKLFIKYQNDIDIVVSDINMPIKNGLDMISDILKIKYIPTILTTAHTDEQYLLNSIDLGVDKYITKPLKTKELVLDIERLVMFNRREVNVKKATEHLVIKSQELNEEKKDLAIQVKQMEKELQRLKALTDSYICTIDTDKQGIIISVSLKFFNLYGYTKDEIIGKKITMIQDETTSGNEIQKYMLEALHHKKAINSIHKFKTKTGKKLECNMVMVPHFAEDGYVNGYTFYQDLIHI